MRDEIARRLVHASGTAVPLSYLFLDPVSWRVVQAFLSLCVVVAAALEAVRLFVGLEWWIYEKLTREYEQDNVAGYALYMVGAAAVALAFPPASAAFEPLPALAGTDVAVPALLMLTVADPFSGLLGSGELRTAKAAYVLLATFGVATLLALPFVSPLAAVCGGAAATVADGVKPVVRGYVLDDNLTIPIAAAAAMFLAVEFLPATPL